MHRSALTAAAAVLNLRSLPPAAPKPCCAGEADKELWAAHDASELVKRFAGPPLPALIDTGTADSFLERELKPGAFEAAAKQAGFPVTMRMQDGYGERSPTGMAPAGTACLSAVSASLIRRACCATCLHTPHRALRRPFVRVHVDLHPRARGVPRQGAQGAVMSSMRGARC